MTWGEESRHSSILVDENNVLIIMKRVVPHPSAVLIEVNNAAMTTQHIQI